MDSVLKVGEGSTTFDGSTPWEERVLEKLDWFNNTVGFCRKERVQQWRAKQASKEEKSLVVEGPEGRKTRQQLTSMVSKKNEKLGD